MTRRERQYRYEKMAQAAASDKSRHFWQEVKNMRDMDCKIKPPNIDGKYSNIDIVEAFCKKFEDLFNLVPSDECKRNDIKDFIGENVIQCDGSDFIVIEDEISNAIHELKNGKSDGDKGLISDPVKLTPRCFTTVLSILLSTVRRHGHMKCYYHLCLPFPRK